MFIIELSSKYRGCFFVLRLVCGFWITPSTDYILYFKILRKFKFKCRIWSHKISCEVMILMMPRPIYSLLVSETPIFYGKWSFVGFNSLHAIVDSY